MVDDGGPVYVRVGEDEGKVVVVFTKDPEGSHPATISHWRTDPEECVQIITAMADAAFRADSGLRPVGSALKASLVEQHRMKLTQRFALMLGTIREDRLISNGLVAQKLVDAAIREIF